MISLPLGLELITIMKVPTCSQSLSVLGSELLSWMFYQISGHSYRFIYPFRISMFSELFLSKHFYNKPWSGFSIYRKRQAEAFLETLLMGILLPPYFIIGMLLARTQHCIFSAPGPSLVLIQFYS